MAEGGGLLRLPGILKQAESFKFFGLFLRTNLVGVGSRWMVLGPGLGTLVGTRQPIPMCAHRAHAVQ